MKILLTLSSLLTLIFIVGCEPYPTNFSEEKLLIRTVPMSTNVEVEIISSEGVEEIGAKIYFCKGRYIEDGDFVFLSFISPYEYNEGDKVKGVLRSVNFTSNYEFIRGKDSPHPTTSFRFIDIR